MQIWRITVVSPIFSLIILAVFSAIFYLSPLLFPLFSFSLQFRRGLVDLHAPVSKYWPAFGKNGKADITVVSSSSMSGISVRPSDCLSVCLSICVCVCLLSDWLADRFTFKIFRSYTTIYYQFTEYWFFLLFISKSCSYDYNTTTNSRNDISCQPSFYSRTS